MGKADKIIQRILSGASDTSISFKALCNLLCRLEFEERIRGDHHIFTRVGIEEIINIQPIGSKAKPIKSNRLETCL